MREEPPPHFEVQRTTSRHFSRLLLNKKSRAQQVDPGNALGTHIDERDLLDDLRRSVATSQPEPPHEAAARADRLATRIEDDEVGGRREPSLESPRDLVASGSHFKTTRQMHPRMGRRRQAVGEPLEVAQREGSEEEIQRGLVDHAAKLDVWVQPRINRSVDLGLNFTR